MRDRRRLREIDLTDLDNFANGFPHDLFETHRREAPVWWHEPTEHTPDDEGFWSVATYDETLTVLQNPEVYSSERGGQRAYGGTALKDLDMAGVSLNMMDDPRHARIRRLVSSRVSARRVARLEVEVRRRTRAQLAGVEDGVELDFVGLATEVPLQIICMLLGIPEEDRHDLWDLVDSGLDIPGSEAHPAPTDDGRPTKAHMFEYASRLVATKRQRPRDDMLSVIVHGDLSGIDPPTMSDAEIYSLLRGIFGAGWETTRAAIASGVLALTAHPEQLRVLRTEASLMPSAVEETLRWSTPSPSKRRTATRPTELGGHSIGAGDKVLVWEASANRDERVFPRANEFDVRRDPNPHIAFGAGVHFCFGAHLARLEMRVMYEELFSEFSDLEVTRPVEWTRGNRHTGPRHLWVRLSRS